MRIEAHYREERIVVLFKGAESYEHANEMRRQVAASRYLRKYSDRDAGLFAFGYPLSVDTCVEMREAWGQALQVAKPLTAWYRQAAAQRAEQAAIGTQTDAKLLRVPGLYPKLNAWLHGDQRVTAAWVREAYRGGGLLADEVGTGKTVGVVAGLVERGITGPTLIVCPKISVRSVWGREFARHCPDVPVYLARGNRKNREKVIGQFQADATPGKVLVVVAEMLRIRAERARGRVQAFYGYEYPELFDVVWSAVVVDESHKLMGAMDVVKATLAGEGLKALSYTPDRLKLAVSATPFGKGGRVEALFGTLHWLWPDEFPSRWAWLGKYFHIEEDKVFVRGGGGATQTVRRVGKPIDEARLWRELGPRVLRRTMEEVSPDHRGLKNWIEVLCEMEPAQARQYKTFALHAELAVDGGVIDAMGTLDFMTRCRQLANGELRREGGRVVYTGLSAKLDRMVDLLDQFEPERKVVISSQYNEFLDVAGARLTKEGYEFYRLDGKTSEGNRERMMNAFQGEDVVLDRVACPICFAGTGKRHGAKCLNQRPRLFLLNSQAGGVSITLDAADAMFQLDEMYPPEANTQLYGRIFRRGRVHEVLYYLFRSMGTIDEQIGYKVGEGHAAQLRLLDGRRGLEYVRKVAQYQEEDK